MLEEIISYLPAKAFFKLLVCKTFCQLSLDSHFQLSQSYHNKTIFGFIVHSDNILKSIILIDPYAGMSSSSLEFIADMESIILGLAGGLVFILNHKYEGFDATITGICVYNPARGTRCKLPSPSDVYPGGCRVARAWTMDKELDFGHQQLDLEDPVVCDDAMFWLSSDLKSYARIGRYVITFDVREECTQIIPLPTSGLIDLCLLKKTSDNMPEWVKMHEISLAHMGFTGEPFFVNYVELIEVATTTLLVFTAYDSTYSCNIKDGGELKWQDCWRFAYSPKFISYSDTLRPCGDHEELLEAI
ncbi:hypothetical protein MUK42_00290 [Musa troglodytarum]|uniref:F-box domain-containing protein n=1 Tax=Musa troglodytarum TaxID=320322 RepID=A0A9E7JT48_9LILI|nr:hypothetical protein MUK42_00290 [Musa troglodytarum]